MTIGLRGSPAVSYVDPTTHSHWVSLLRHHDAGLFHSPPWVLALMDAYSLKIQACVLGDPPRAGLAFCELDDRAGRRIVSLPFSDACEPIVDDPELLTPLVACLQSRQVPVFLRSRIDLTSLEGFTTTKLARWHSLDLSPPLDRLWGGFDPSTRRAIRKAQREGVTIRPLSSNSEIEAFHRLHVTLRKCKYRMLAQPITFFHAIARRFQEANGWFSLGAFLGDRLVAGTIYLRWRNTLYYKFNASDPAALHSRPNNLLVWEAIRQARSFGCDTLDFGPSDDDQPGLIRFKHDFGAREDELRFLRWLPAGWDDARAVAFHHELSQLTSRVTAPLVSDEEAARAGADLYQYFA